MGLGWDRGGKEWGFTFPKARLRREPKALAAFFEEVGEGERCRWWLRRLNRHIVLLFTQSSNSKLRYKIDSTSFPL